MANYTETYGAGAVVHGTEAFINASEPSKNEPYTETSGLSAEMKTFYDKALIELASPHLVFDRFGQKRTIPAGGGKTIEFRRFNTLPKALQPITEGVTPSGSKMTVVPITATVDQYGDYIEQTDLFELTAVDNTVVETTRKLADQAGRTLDTVVRNAVVGGTNVLYCPKEENGTYTDITSRSEITSDAKLRVKDVFRAAALLKGMNAPKIDGAYVAVIHPYVAYDLMQEAGDQWVSISKYTDPSGILCGELGMLGGVRFIESTEAKIFCGADLAEDARALAVNKADGYTAATEIAFDGGTVKAGALVGRTVLIGSVKAKVLSNTANTMTLDTPVTCVDGAPIWPGEGGKDGCAVFATMFLGADAYGVTDLAGGGIEHIIKQRGYGNDPLNQRSSIGWKAYKVACRLVEEYMLRVESGSSFAAGALEAN